MTMKLSILLTADGKVAKAEVVSLENEVDKLGKTADKAGKKTKGLGKNTATLGDAAENAKLGVDKLSDSQRRNVPLADGMAAANRRMTHASSQMFAQMNDVFVMMAAGQAPMQTGTQQGFQIAQALGPLGAAGAAKALAGGLAQMLSPMTFLTIGTIAGTSALYQWATGATSGVSAASDLSDAISDVEQKLSDYIDLVAKSGTSGAADFELIRRQLQLTSEAYSDLIAIAKIDAFKSIETLNSSLVSSVVSASWLKTQMGDVGDLLNVETILRGNVTEWKNNREQVSGFIADLEGFQNAVGLDAQYAAAINLRDTFKQTVDISGDLTTEQIEFWRMLSQSIQQMELLGAATETLDLTISRAAQNAGRFYSQSRQQSNEALSSAQELTQELRTEAYMRAIVVRFGADSVQATLARVTAERASFLETARSRDVSEEVKVELIAAWDAANGIAGVDMAGNIALATGQASLLSQQLGKALSLASRIAGYNTSVNDNGLDTLDPRNPSNTRAGTWTGDYGTVSPFDPSRKKPDAPKGRSGSAITSAGREQKAVDDLIASLKEQRDVIAETDPVQKEMIRNREVLAKATDAERTKVEELIAARIAEEAAIDRATEKADFYGGVIRAHLMRLPGREPALMMC